MALDYNPPNQSRIKRTSVVRRLLILTGLVLIPALSFFLYRAGVPQTEARSAPDHPQILTASPQTLVDEIVAEPQTQRETRDGVIRSGETLTALLGDYLTPQEIHRLSQKSRSVFPLTGLVAGRPYQLCLEDGCFESFLYEIDRSEQLLIRRDGERFEISLVPIAYTVEVGIVSGTITSSLFNAVTQIGEAPELAINLADIFAWDIDFILDIREGDSFQAIVEKRYREGEPAGYGKILAAEFVNRGTAYRAILFQDGDRRAEYFDADGKSMRKAFLRAPLEFTRISSGFSMRRLHPITKTWKSHPAIDYAAPVGTPIMSVGDGSIVNIGYTNGNGNYIKIRHSNGYETMYLHMSRFAKGMKQGRRVKQGEVIGYVGATGLATGPHLCFRMTRNGEPVNPQRIKPPAAPSVSANNLEEFRALAAPLISQLDNNARRQAGLAEKP